MTDTAAEDPTGVDGATGAGRGVHPGPPTDTAERFRRVAGGLTRTIAAVPPGAWGDPAPCQGWTALDVVRHLVDWLPGPGLLLGAFGVTTRALPPVEEDPAGAWAVVRDAIAGALADPSVAKRVEDCGPLGRLTFEAAVDLTCTPDVFVHTWDLAVATGVAVELAGEELARQAAVVDAVPPEVDAAMRSSGHYGPRVEVPVDADDLTRVLAFYGRRQR
jgi:uncharacterized protein (TIGR03086 family)